MPNKKNSGSRPAPRNTGRKPSESSDSGDNSPQSPTSARAYSWFPGHMRKAMRQLEEQLSLADIVLLVLDARLPGISRQPELEEMLQRRQKKLALILNKADLAEEKETQRWLKNLRSQGFQVAAMRATSGKGAGSLESTIAKLRQEIDASRKQKGLLSRDPRLIVAGIPNVGKSSLLNRLAGAARAKTGAKPGVTRGNQWVAVTGKWQVLDSPGILYPRIEGQEALTYLAAASCIKHDAIPLERVGALLLARLLELGKANKLLNELTPAPAEELLQRLAREKNFTLSQDELDLLRASRFVLKAFAQGNLGPVTLERLPQTSEQEGPQVDELE